MAKNKRGAGLADRVVPEGPITMSRPETNADLLRENQALQKQVEQLSADLAEAQILSAALDAEKVVPTDDSNHVTEFKLKLRATRDAIRLLIKGKPNQELRALRNVPDDGSPFSHAVHVLLNDDGTVKED